MHTLLALFATALLPGDTASVPAATAAAALKLEPAITARELEAHVRWLASDALGGRVTGTPQCDEAAAYLVRILEREGWKPAGDAGTFLQKVALHRVRFDAAPDAQVVDASGKPVTLAFGVDFDAPSIAIHAKELKLVVVSTAADLPAKADPKTALFVDATTTERRRWLDIAGLGTGAGFGLLLAPGSTKAGHARDVRTLGGSLRRDHADAEHAAEPVVRIHGNTLERMKHGDFRTISLATHIVDEHLASSNVVARLDGRAPADGAARKAIVLSAHYDHIDHGHGESAPGADTIYNGADDDASGVALVLELAGALASEPPPANDLVILLATGEEVGLLGTDEYLDHPVVPLAQTIANLNFEMLGRPDEKVGGAGVMWITGPAETNLEAALVEAGINVKPDPRPDQNFYERSDNIAFVRRGVVGQTFSTYNMHTDYHEPSDEADKIDFKHLAGCASAALEVVRLVASNRIVPNWATGHEPKSRK